MAQFSATHYGMLSGLDHSWEVANVKLELEAKRVTIQLGFTGERVTCPCCEASCTEADHAPERTWRHLDTMQFETVFVARVPRADCKVCGVKTPEVPWAGKHSPFTWMFEAFARMILEASRCVEAARRVLRLSWDAVHRIMKRGVDRGLIDRDLSTVEKVGMDEKSFLKGKSYVTTLCDLEKVRVMEVVEGRKEEDARAVIASLPEGVRAGIPGRGLCGESLRTLVCLGDPQPPEAGEAGGEDAQEAPAWVVSILPSLDHQCRRGGTQQQDRGNQVGSKGIPQLRELPDTDPVLLRPAVDATENRPLNLPKNPSFFLNRFTFSTTRVTQ